MAKSLTENKKESKSDKPIKNTAKLNPPTDSILDEPWADGIVEFSGDMTDPISTVILNFGKVSAQFKESTEYMLKLTTILETPRVKEELGEQLIGMTERQHGIFKKEIENWILTNYRVIYTDERTNDIIQIPLKYVDITVSNAHSVSDRTGGIAGGMMPGFMYAGMGFTQGQSTSSKYGDLNFIFNGQVIIVIPQVQDPNGLKQLLYQIKKQIHNIGGVYE